jgi:hypothetical protein
MDILNFTIADLSCQLKSTVNEIETISEEAIDKEFYEAYKPCCERCIERLADDAPPLIRRIAQFIPAGFGFCDCCDDEEELFRFKLEVTADTLAQEEANIRDLKLISNVVAKLASGGAEADKLRTALTNALNVK